MGEIFSMTYGQSLPFHAFLVGQVISAGLFSPFLTLPKTQRTKRGLPFVDSPLS